MHGKKTLNRLLNERSKKPDRSAYRTNTGIVMVGDWRLQEDEDGNLVATNAATGLSTIVAFRG